MSFSKCMYAFLVRFLLVGLPTVGYNQELVPEDAFAMSIEELMSIKVVSATKTEIKLSDAPASLTVITKADIQKYGYRTLSEALARVPEVYVHYYGTHNYADFRGFFSNNTSRRVLYLLNGHKLNDRFHFGELFSDVVSDLSNIERIEITRGPGAALYGNNSNLGVVNLITKDALRDPEVSVATEFSYLKTNSLQHKYRFTYRKALGKNLNLSANIYWFDGKIEYMTNTQWQSPETTKPGLSNVYYSTDAYFNVDKNFDNNAFETGSKLPNININIEYKDFAVGGYLLTKAASWVWPKDAATFNHPQNDVSWGTGSIYISYKPMSNLLAEKDFSVTVSYNTNTNREIAVHNTADAQLRYGTVPNDTSGVFADSWQVFVPYEEYRDGNYIMNGGLMQNQLYTDSETGTPYIRVNDCIDPNAFSEEYLDANGGGARFLYYGIDKTLGLNFQMTPYKRSKLKLMLGGDFNYSRYTNYQRFTYVNNNYISWAKWGGITDSGYNGGLWAQAIYKASNKIDLIAGVRYDYQKIIEVYRQLGGVTRYTGSNINSVNRSGNFSPIYTENKEAKDLTPRLALNFRFNSKSNLRLLYAQAFRAVSPQEVNRLSDPGIEAMSEKTHNVEAIYSRFFSDELSLTVNAFYLKGSELYSWSPVGPGQGYEFARGKGWQNYGGSFELKFIRNSFESWANTTVYKLERATDAYRFMVDENNDPLENQWKPLDSPEFLFKMGGSYKFKTNTIVASEFYYNGEILSIHAHDLEHITSPSMYLNLIISHDFAKLGLKGLRAMIKAENILNQSVMGILPSDAEESFGKYEKPHQLPSFGRYFSIQLSYNF